MLKIGLNNNFYTDKLVNVKTEKPSAHSVNTTNVSAPEYKPISFKAAPFVSLRTALTDKKEQKMYAKILSALTKENKANLEVLLKSGKLLNNGSNDKSTTLENLYQIIDAKRLKGLDAESILNETVETLANPYRITQRFGDIPIKFAGEIVKNENKILNNKVKE